MKIHLKSGRICKSSKHFVKFELPKIYNKYKPNLKPLLSVWNNFKFEETPLMKMIKI